MQIVPTCLRSFLGASNYEVISSKHLFMRLCSLHFRPYATSSRTAALCASLLLCGLFFWSPPAMASVTYTYIGHDFTTYQSPYKSTDHVSGSLTFSTPLPRNLTYSDLAGYSIFFSFTDGVQTLTNIGTNANAYLFDPYAATNSSGAISEWSFSFINGSNSSDKIVTQDHSSAIGDLGQKQICLKGFGCLNYQGSTTSPGRWPVPEPSTILVLGSGLLGLAVTYRRRRLGRQTQ